METKDFAKTFMGSLSLALLFLFFALFFCLWNTGCAPQKMSHNRAVKSKYHR